MTSRNSAIIGLGYIMLPGVMDAITHLPGMFLPSDLIWGYQIELVAMQLCSVSSTTVKPVSDHLYNKIYSLWFIQQCVLMKTEDTNLLLLIISAFWSSFRWPRAT